MSALHFQLDIYDTYRHTVSISILTGHLCRIWRRYRQWVANSLCTDNLNKLKDHQLVFLLLHSVQGCKRAGANPSCHWIRVFGYTPDRLPLHHKVTQVQTTTHSCEGVGLREEARVPGKSIHIQVRNMHTPHRNVPAVIQIRNFLTVRSQC